MIGYDDKRNFYRMMMNAGCELQVSDEESTRTIAAICKDMSATGMSFEVEESIELGAQLHASIESTNTQIPSLSAKVKVIRCEQEDESCFLVGVEVTEMN